MKSGVACGYHATPVICAVKKKTPPLFIIGGLNKMKPGSVMDIMLPHDPSPPDDRGDKKFEWSGVWVTHCLFMSGRPNKAVCGMHTASFTSGRSNELVCGVHTTLLASKMMLQKGGGTNASSLPPPGVSPSLSFPCPFPLLFLITPTYPPQCLSHSDMAFDGCLWSVMWPGEVIIGMGDVVWGFVKGSDMADVICPHPLTRGGVNTGGC